MKLDPGPSTFDLDVKELFVSHLWDDDLTVDPSQLKTVTQYRVEYMAKQMTAMLRIPAKVLQDNRVIASYPDGLWQYIRKACGLKYRKYEAKLSEWLVFPQYKLPPGIGKFRVAVMPRLDCVNWKNG